MKAPDRSRLMKTTAAVLGATCVVALLTAGSRGPKEEDYAIKVSLVGACWWNAEWKDPSCGCESQVTTLTAAAGELSDLGAVWMVASHCAPVPPYTKYIGTKMTLVTAEGELWATYDSDNATVDTFVVTFAGGTGRFKHAKGSGLLTWKAVPQFNPDGGMNFALPWPWSAEIHGTLSHCSPDKDCRHPLRPDGR